MLSSSPSLLPPQLASDTLVSRSARCWTPTGNPTEDAGSVGVGEEQVGPLAFNLHTTHAFAGRMLDAGRYEPHPGQVRAMAKRDGGAAPPRLR